MPALPDLDAVWDELEEKFRDGMEKRKPDSEFDFEPFDKLSKFAEAIRECEPDYLNEKGFPDKYDAEIATICAAAEIESHYDGDFDDPEDLMQISERMGSIAKAVERLSDISHSFPQAVSIANDLRRAASRLEEKALESEQGEPDHGDEGYRRDDSNSFDIPMLFSEL